MDTLLTVIKKKHLLLEQKEGISFVIVSTPEEGLLLLKDLLYAIVDSQTLLFLSGGSTPKPLYETLAKEKELHPGAIALVDERFGVPMHEKSNEKMMRDVGLLTYLQEEQTPFYGILKEGVTRQQAANEYDDLLHVLLPKYNKKITLLGIGDDGHTSGIAPNREDFTNTLFTQYENAYVGEFDDPKGSFGQRVTTTFMALKQMGILIPVVFGEKKKHALKALFAQGPFTEIPVRFYTRPDIAPKTLFITDQKV